MDHAEAHQRVLDAAEELFYERGIQAVGMDEIRTTAGVPLKRLYQCFPSKRELVEAYLRRRDRRWRDSLADHVARHAATAKDRPLAVFDWLHAWFSTDGFRGCAFLNAFGEFGTAEPGVADIARCHKTALQQYLAELVEDLAVPDSASLANQLLVLVEGAITTAAITNSPNAAAQARAAAATLLTASIASR